MATQVQFRRGTTTQNNAFTGAVGEITYDTEVKTLRLHDGSTAGGGATLVNLNAAQNLTNKTLSTNSTWNGNAVGLTYGGTGAALTAVAGGIAYSGASALAISAAGTSGQLLTSGGNSAPTWVNASSLTVGTATTATTAVNISGGSPGYIMYQVDTNQTGFITPGASGYILRSTGSSTAPTWVTSALTIGTTALQVGDTAATFNGLNQLNATGTSHWTLPVGTTAQRPGTPATGMIRYNSDLSTFEGYAASAWGSLGGVKSVDGYTYILAETSAGASNGDLDFYAENAGGNGATQVGQWNRTNLKDYTGTLVGTQTTQNVFNATATTVNAFGAATTLTIGATTGTATIRNTTVAVTNNATVGGTLGVTGATTLSSTLAVNGASLTTTQTTFNLLNTTATTLNIGGAATTVSFGAATGTTTVNHNLTVSGNLTVNGTTTTINASTLAVDDNIIKMAEGNAANSLDIGFVGNYTSGSALHTGLIKQASANKWLLLSGIAEPGNTVSLTGASYDWLKLGTVEATTSVVVNGATSGAITISAPATAGTNTLTLPAATDTLVGRATTDTLTNKTLTTPTINGGTATALTGLAVRDTSAAFDVTIAATSSIALTAGRTLSLDMVNASRTVKLAGNLEIEGKLTHAGAFNQTFTATGNTSVTLPTSGTLATLAGTETLTNKTLTFPIIDNIRLGYTATATAAGTTTLTATSNHQQRFTGSTTQTVVLPVTSTLAAGVTYQIENASTGNLTVNSSGGNLVATVIPGTTVDCTCIGTTLTTAADWDPEYRAFAAITGTGSVVLSTSPTLVTPVLGTPTSGTLTNCTGLPVSGITASTTTALGVGSIELGHASDTTIARSAAGVVTIEGVEVVTLSRTQTLTNKTLTLPTIGGTGAVFNGSTSGTITVVATATAGTNTLTLPAATGTILSTASTTANVQFNSLGLGTAPSNNTGELRATGSITGFYSDERLKTDITEITNAVDKVMQLRGVTFRANEIAESYGYSSEKEQVGVLAQDVEKVLPQVVVPAPFDIMQLQEGIEISRSGENYKTVHYEKIVPLLIQAIKEQQIMIEELKKKVGI